MFAQRLLLIGLLSSAGIVACSANAADEEIASENSELRLTGIENLGAILNGETRQANYSGGAQFRSYEFNAKGGDHVTADVKAIGGDGVAFITDPSGEVLAHDPGGAGEDARVTYDVPAGTPPSAHRIVFRDARQVTATVNVKLGIRGPGPAVCSYHGQSYAAGDVFTAGDGCNTCSCGGSGGVSCSQQVCACNPGAEPWRTYVGTAVQCLTLQYSCPGGQFKFSNNCGCGCERLH